MTTGDDWKARTPYEEPEDRFLRDLGEVAAQAAAALRSMSDSMGRVARGSLIDLSIRVATAQLVRAGVARDRAELEVRECAMIAAAEGRLVTAALKVLVASHALP